MIRTEIRLKGMSMGVKILGIVHFFLISQLCFAVTPNRENLCENYLIRSFEDMPHQDLHLEFETVQGGKQAPVYISQQIGGYRYLLDLVGRMRLAPGGILIFDSEGRTPVDFVAKRKEFLESIWAVASGEQRRVIQRRLELAAVSDLSPKKIKSQDIPRSVIADLLLSIHFDDIFTRRSSELPIEIHFPHMHYPNQSEIPYSVVVWHFGPYELKLPLPDMADSRQVQNYVAMPQLFVFGELIPESKWEDKERRAIEAFRLAFKRQLSYNPSVSYAVVIPGIAKWAELELGPF